ncbi:2-phospho-L-lactate transferase [Aromatoleum diolicum]|uniref:2-phospho-L-lactate transferase n=1 Tax=Aromatoleum diolicum TaxID=75796 RepID=A0ABX1QHE6_9RHOO|nr:2-phospho-L-lactate transferase [Aromatoleum diolicum]NMG76465.1 2-phospho-L-lactate transferase [Aromatoleum diolicum]
MSARRIVALSGGVGGAKLADGLMRVLPQDTLTVVVNTGDDFRHLGLHISPDIDTVLYTLCGLANPETGWGRRNETWQFMQALASLGGETWFRLGDADLAMHIERTRRLDSGQKLSSIVADCAHRLGIRAEVLPMTDAPVRTRVDTTEGRLDFQDYFVRRQCAPVVSGLRYDGAARAEPVHSAVAAIRSAAAILICPSNPYLSIAPMLAVPGLRQALRDAEAPVIAVSPLINGAAVKGPTAKIMAELGLPVCAPEIARHYGDLIDGFVLDERDAALADQIDIPVCLADTLMKDIDDRERVARASLAFAERLRAEMIA